MRLELRVAGFVATCFLGWLTLLVGPGAAVIGMPVVAAGAVLWLPGPLGVAVPVRRWWLHAVGAWAVGLGAGAAAVGLAIAFGVGRLDAELSGFRSLLESQPGTRAGLAASAMHTLALFQVLQVLGAPLLHAPLAILEEVGWRGALVRAVAPRGKWVAALGSGALWGLWVAPLLAPERLDVGLGLGLTWGAWLGALRVRSDSIWPSVIGRGAVAGAVALAPLAGIADPLHGPLGWPGWIVVGGLVAVQVARDGAARRK